MKTPEIKKLNIPAIINMSSCLKCKRYLTMSQNNLTYLDIEDAYIHKLFPLLQDQKIKMPDYFDVTDEKYYVFFRKEIV